MSGLTIIKALGPDEQKRADALARGKFMVTERLVRTPEGTIVAEDRAFNGGVFLYPVGTEIPLEEARAVGLIAEVAVTPIAEPNPIAAVTAIPKPRREKGK